jgi:diacylglycerol kinase (ATP)
MAMSSDLMPESPPTTRLTASSAAILSPAGASAPVEAPESKTGVLPEKKAAVVGMKRLTKAFFYSMEGLGSTWKHEEAFRQEMWLAMVLVPVAAVLPVGLEGKAVMIGSVLLVLIVELLNSGLEWCVDLAARQQRHPFAKRAKDMGSAAVFLSLVNCLLAWVLVLGQAVLDHRLHL